MKNEIEEGFARQGEDKGMNEMCNNVIDNIVEGKEINELFNPPAPKKKTLININKLPKINNKEDEDKKINCLFSEKFITKQHKKNYKDKTNSNIKFKQGETEKILAYEYYQNSYKQCVKINHSQEPLNSIRANYKIMWNNVNSFVNKGHKNK